MEKRLNDVIASHLLDIPLERIDAVNAAISLDSHLLSCVSEKIANPSVRPRVNNWSNTKHVIIG